MSEKRGHSGGQPDYEMDEILEVWNPEQFRAAGDQTRSRIISLLSEKAATTSQLAEALGQPKGSVGHHLKVLEEAGLIRVVRTRQVRALTEKYYGRTARLFKFMDMGKTSVNEPVNFFHQAMNEWVLLEDPDSDLQMSTLRHARIPPEKVREFSERVMQLADEFADLEKVPGEQVYGFVAGVFLTDLPELPEEEE